MNVHMQRIPTNRRPYDKPTLIMKHAYMLLIGLACAALASAQLQNG